MFQTINQINLNMVWNKETNPWVGSTVPPSEFADAHNAYCIKMHIDAYSIFGQHECRCIPRERFILVVEFQKGYIAKYAKMRKLGIQPPWKRVAAQGLPGLEFVVGGNPTIPKSWSEGRNWDCQLNLLRIEISIGKWYSMLILILLNIGSPIESTDTDQIISTSVGAGNQGCVLHRSKRLVPIPSLLSNKITRRERYQLFQWK